MKLFSSVAAALKFIESNLTVGLAQDLTRRALSDGQKAGSSRTAPPTKTPTRRSTPVSAARRTSSPRTPSTRRSATPSRRAVNLSQWHNGFVDLSNGTRVLLVPGEEVTIPDGVSIERMLLEGTPGVEVTTQISIKRSA